jgi:hypothetical protein
MDNSRYYDPPSSPSSSTDSEASDAPASHTLTTNSGNKLEYSARYARRGKAYAWGPAYEEGKQDSKSRKRMKRALEAVFPEVTAELGTQPPPNILASEKRRDAKRARKEHDREFRLPHLRSVSPPTSTSKLAPTLAIPTTYTEIMTSTYMRYTMANDKMDRGLVDTSNELLESEKGLMQALGSLREVLRLRHRDIDFGFPDLVRSTGDDVKSDDETAPKDTDAASAAPSTHYSMGTGYVTPPDQVLIDGTEDSKGKKYIAPLPRIAETDNLWRVTQEMLTAIQPTPTIEYTITKPGQAVPTPIEHDASTLTPVQRLFTAKSGLTIAAIPPAGHVGALLPSGHLGRSVTTTYNVDLPAQTRAVDDALERIMELLVDVNEYKERLEETRDRVADIARVRKRVWSVIKERTGRELEQNDR